MRLFLAGPLPEAVQAEVQAAVETVRRAACQVRWVAAGQLHLTLAFLGEVGPPALPPLVDALRAVVPRHHRLELILRGSGCFGRPRQPQVLFAEVAGDLQALTALASDVRAALGVLLAPPAQGTALPFHPHLTLARARARHGDAALAVCQRALRDRLLGAFLLDRLVLFQSEPQGGGRAHTPLAEFPLSGATGA